MSCLFNKERTNINTKDQKTPTTNWSPLTVAALSVLYLGVLQELLVTGCITLGTKEQSEGLSIFLKNLLPTITLTALPPASLLEGGQILEVATSTLLQTPGQILETTGELSEEGQIAVKPFPSLETAFVTILRKGLQLTALKTFITVSSVVLGNLNAPIFIAYTSPSGGKALIGVAYSVADRIGCTSFIAMCYTGAVHWFPRPSRAIGSLYNNSMGGIGSFYKKLTGPIKSFYTRVTGGDDFSGMGVETYTYTIEAYHHQGMTPSSVSIFKYMTTKLLEILFASSLVVNVPVPFIILSVCAFMICQPEQKMKKEDTDIIIDLGQGCAPTFGFVQQGSEATTPGEGASVGPSETSTAKGS